MKTASLAFGVALACAAPFAAQAITVTVFVDPDGPGGAPPLSSGPIAVNNSIPNGSLFSGAATGGVVDVTPIVNALNSGGGGRIGDVDFRVRIDHEGQAPGFVELRFIAGLNPLTGTPFSDGNTSTADLTVTTVTVNLANGEFVGLNVTTNSVQGATDPITAANGANGNNNQLTRNFTQTNPGNVLTPTDVNGQKSINTSPQFNVVENAALSFYAYWEQAQTAGDNRFSIFFNGASGDEEPPEIPLPAGVVLLLTALGGFGLLRRRRTT